MRDEPFRRYLREVRRTKSEVHFDEKQISDAVSRCRRVERVLGVNLDYEALDPNRLERRMEDRMQDFQIRGDQERGLANLRHAVRMYADFLGGGWGTQRR